jgi:pyruvate/2-oxoglutarate dehydrogenase complex dihydrolipoamide dehydrogenase (E3) component
MQRMRRIRARIAEYQSVERQRARGVDVFFGEARFGGPRVLLVDGLALSFRKALIATGARPRLSDIPSLEEIGYLTSANVYEIDALPRRLAIVGGGPLGCESAQTFRRLGSQVTIVQSDPKFLPFVERDAAEILSRALARDGVETRLNTTVVGAHVVGGEKWVETVRDDVRQSIAVDAVLLSIGRAPNVAGLGLDAAGVEFDLLRGIKTDDYLCSTNPDIYAAGDACMAYKYTNAAETSARMAVQNAFGSPVERKSHLLIPRCTYCDPEIAQIGLHVLEARARSIPVESYTVMMQDVDRAIMDGHDQGFVKIHVRDGTDEILGATIVAARASEMINEMSVVMSAGIGMRRLAGIMHTYPAQSGAIRLAAMAFMRREAISFG